MSLFEILGAVLIGPLKTLFEIIFAQAYAILNNPGLAVIVLSLAMNILVLPLYKRADAIQIEARDTENKLKDVVTHIKKTFSGDERMMILQTYYRQNNYNPLSVLSGSISLLLEIPFFMAAYQFLSKLDIFQGASFGPISDLSAPDGLLTLGGITVNLLPIIMTLVNVVSSSLYLKGFPLKTKIQLYGMALFFLVFLYNSPAALVFYWTLNNTFSLVKTIFYRLKNSRKVLGVFLAVAGAALIFATRYIHGYWKTAFLILVGLAAQLPWLLPLVAKKLPAKEKAVPAPNTKLFVLGGLFLTVLVGLLIPTTYIAASPQEYIDLNFFYNPIWYVVKTLCLSAGFFLVWFSVFYWLANPKGKVIFTRLIWVLAGVMLANYMFFGRGLGIMTADLLFETGVAFAPKEHIINLAVVLAVIVGMYFICVKFPQKLSSVLLIGVIALTSMSVINTVKINKVVAETKARIAQEGDGTPSFNLSKNGQNVVVIMLDRAVGPYVPYIMEEIPGLKAQFDGFTYYRNTISYGGFTNFGAPALYGGYEYTPVEMNKRADELLKDKHNEALKVVPTIMAEEGFNVTVMDPSYANYKVIPDLSIYDDMEGVTAYAAKGAFNNSDSRITAVENRQRNFFFFSMMKVLPVSLQKSLYQEGNYHAIRKVKAPDVTDAYSAELISEYNTVKSLTAMTGITEDGSNNYMFYRTNLTHQPEELQEPDYTLSTNVDNSAYHPDGVKIISAEGEETYKMHWDSAINHYHVNALAYKLLGQWFDYLRENGVYDNTRIILVSDHARDMQTFYLPEYGNYIHNIEMYLPVLMVKDFNATGFNVSNEFMTNGDVPALSMEGLVEDPVNPFTGNAIDTSGKEGTQYVIISEEWDTTKNNGNQFIQSEWAAVSGDARDLENWEFYKEPAYFPPDVED